MIAAGGIDAVTVTTPPQTRRALVLEAIAAGLHVIADKPFAPSAADARELDAAAKAKGVVLGVFHNRRFDADVQTLRKVIADGRLGRIWRVHSRMDFDDPATLEAGPTGGLLRDLGSHLVDQILWLLGPAVSVDAQLDMVELPEGTTDAGFTITLRHEGGVHSHLSASKLNRLIAKEYRAYGEAGSYVRPAPTSRRRRSLPAAARSMTSSAGDTSARNIGERWDRRWRGAGPLRAGPLPRLLRGLRPRRPRWNRAPSDRGGGDPHARRPRRRARKRGQGRSVDVALA